ncbi:MAG: hypothetical protein NC305_11430 [Lachnospiraceae bacterium]|nr:hypothetical protein [Butyrivibrio sp.]MCM1344443.1 hypothetical protein [Muribaculaceae bacterium]MCM1411145.1 hypothetical protein [Lachnospiraceae bacterium]
MKRLNAFKKILALTVSALMLAVLPNANALTVSAEEPATYYVLYKDDGWFYQPGSIWDDTRPDLTREVYYMNEMIKDGDIVIVGNGARNNALTINAHLSNLTIANTSDIIAVVSVSGGIDNCYFLDNTRASVSGDVFNGYVYDTATANFNNNVANLYSYDDVRDGGPTIAVHGTVTYFTSEDGWDGNPPYGNDFAANTFAMEKGNLTTDPIYYSRDGVSPATANTTAATPQPAPSSSSNEYDKVPKTGETSPIIWLSLIAVSCSGASLLLKRSEKK